MIGFPMILPMGWVDSPPFLCAITKTVADLANMRLASGDLSYTPHHLDALADSPPTAFAARARSATASGLSPPPL